MRVPEAITVLFPTFFYIEEETYMQNTKMYQNHNCISKATLYLKLLFGNHVQTHWACPAFSSMLL